MALRDVVMLDHGKVVGQNPGFIQSTDIVYDNTGSDLDADNVQDAVDEVNERISANTFGTDVQLTYDTDYTTLSDGYFRVYIPSGTNYAQGSVNGQALIKINATSSQSAIDSIFVKKGMVLKFTASSSSANAQGRFYPLS